MKMVGTLPGRQGWGACWASDGWFQLPLPEDIYTEASVPDPALFWKVSYAIGVAEPLSISIFTYGTSQKTERELLDVVNKNFDLRPGVIVR